MTKLEQRLSIPTGDPKQDKLRAEMLKSVQALNAWGETRLALAQKMLAEAKERQAHD